MWSSISLRLIGRLPLFEATQALLLQDKRTDGLTGSNNEEPINPIDGAKKIALLTLEVAHQRHGANLEQQQEILLNLADIILEIFAMESMSLQGIGHNAADACGLSAHCHRQGGILIENDPERLRSEFGITTISFADTGICQQRSSRCLALRRRIAGRLLVSAT